MVPCQCPSCFHIFEVDDTYAGKSVECHQCGTPTLVPIPAYAAYEPRVPKGKVEDATVRVVWTIWRIIVLIVLVFCIVFAGCYAVHLVNEASQDRMLEEIRQRRRN